MIPDRLLGEVEQYKAGSGARCVCFQVGDQVYLVFPGYRIPSDRYTASATDVLVMNTVDYPSTAFDMFFTPDNVRLKENSALPAGATAADHLGGGWLQWSIHPYQNTQWSPARDSLGTFMRYVEQRFRNGD